MHRWRRRIRAGRHRPRRDPERALIVVDASVLANFVADDGPDGVHARRTVSEAGDAAVPDLADVETAAVLRKRWIARTITPERFAGAIDVLVELPPERFAGAIDVLVELPFRRSAAIRRHRCCDGPASFAPQSLCTTRCTSPSQKRWAAISSQSTPAWPEPRGRAVRSASYVRTDSPRPRLFAGSPSSARRTPARTCPAGSATGTPPTVAPRSSATARPLRPSPAPATARPRPPR